MIGFVMTTNLSPLNIVLLQSKNKHTLEPIHYTVSVLKTEPLTVDMNVH